VGDLVLRTRIHLADGTLVELRDDLGLVVVDGPALRARARHRLAQYLYIVLAAMGAF
jgi:hypothetical protein